MSEPLKPFWLYYGAKARIAKLYPPPQYDTIIEPFAGAAGYSLRYPDKNVVLVDKYPVITEVWRYLIAATKADILRIPCVDRVDDLPDWVPLGAKYLIGFCMNRAVPSPRGTATEWASGWSESQRARVANQVGRIKHWRVISGDYSRSPNIEATWFIDPPYQRGGQHYKMPASGIQFASLATWSATRRGQIIVCESAPASWLPFRPLAKTQAHMNSPTGGSYEVIWTKENPA